MPDDKLYQVISKSGEVQTVTFVVAGSFNEAAEKAHTFQTDPGDTEPTTVVSINRVGDHTNFIQ